MRLFEGHPAGGRRLRATTQAARGDARGVPLRRLAPFEPTTEWAGSKCVLTLFRMLWGGERTVTRQMERQLGCTTGGRETVTATAITRSVR